MTIELYVFPPSPRAFKVMAIANHLGIDTKLHFVDLVKGEHRAPDYAALNPNMRMPTLKDGDYVLWEFNAIGQYLAAKKPESGLLPKDERGHLDVTRWQFWELAHWDPSCSVFIFENVVKPLVMKMGEPDAAALAKGAENFHRTAKVLDGQLQGKRFVTGDVADAGGLRARRGAESGRDGAHSDRALWRDQALVRNAARATGLAEDARTMRHAGCRSGLIRLNTGRCRASAGKGSHRARSKGP